METILRAPEKKRMTTGEEEANNIREQISMALTWVTKKGNEESPAWIVLPGTEEERRKTATETARSMMEEAEKRNSEPEEEVRAGEEGGRRRGLRRSGDAQMRFIMERDEVVNLKKKYERAPEGGRCKVPKDRNFIEWTGIIKQSFAKSKEARCQKCVLYIPNDTGEYAVHTDASDFGIGGVLEQPSPGGS